MDGRQTGIDRSRSVEDLHHLQLTALLEELVRDKGVMRAARELDVNYRTISAALESGRLSRRMRLALDRALLSGAGSPAKEQGERNDELAGRLEAVEGRVEEVGRDAGHGLADVQGEVRELRDAQEQSTRRIEGRLAKVEGGGGAPAPSAPAGQLRRSPDRTRRDFPDLATLDPAADDEEVFGDAWALIQEWRELKETHPDRGRGLDWLRREERLLTVELALLEEHGLTLPPETFPLRGLDRGGQVNWRRKALEDTRRVRKRRELLLGLGKVLTLGRWRR